MMKWIKTNIFKEFFKSAPSALNHPLNWVVDNIYNINRIFSKHILCANNIESWIGRLPVVYSLPLPTVPHPILFIFTCLVGNLQRGKNAGEFGVKKISQPAIWRKSQLSTRNLKRLFSC